MRKIILTALAMLVLLCPVIADDERPVYEPMDTAGLIQWYNSAIMKSILEDTARVEAVALLTLSQGIPCFDVKISTDDADYWRPDGRPGWKIDGSNCVDERTYQCEDDNGQE